MELLRDLIHCNYSFVILNPLKKVARLKYMQKHTESTVLIILLYKHIKVEVSIKLSTKGARFDKSLENIYNYK